ncbi:unnamed protein product [Mytilus coruscus]|uniref:OTU domain-containing protein n=1 Tax=Mytilus coruscus TaxID=42192 RepID=A0A6J8C3C8_MYTCO|nr:unnamed protein product [Mytilus coruscus]
MNEDEDDESGVGSMYNRQEAKHSNISFIWGSPLHKMADIEGTDPYDTVDLVDLNADIDSIGLDNQHTTVARGNSYESPYHSDTESSQNTFAIFGYDNLGDLDTSDDEFTESKPVHDFIHLSPTETQPCHEGQNLLLGKLKGFPIHVGGPAELEENRHKQNAHELTKPVYPTLNAKDEKTEHRSDEKDSDIFETTSTDEFSHDQYSHMTNDTVRNPCQEKKEVTIENKCETIAPKQTMSYKEHDNLEKEKQMSTNNYQANRSIATQYHDEEMTEVPTASITEKEPITEEAEEKIKTDKKKSDHLAKSSCEREVENKRNEIVIDLIETSIQSERTTEINFDITNQTPEDIEIGLDHAPTVLYDETYNDRQLMKSVKETSPNIVNEELSTPSDKDFLEASYTSEIKDSFSVPVNTNNFANSPGHSHVEGFSEISYLNVEHDVVDNAVLSASSDRGETNPQLQQSPNINEEESHTENKIEDAEPLNLTKHDIQSELSINRSIKGNLNIIDNSSKAEHKNYPNSTKSSGETIPEKREESKKIYFTNDSTEYVALTQTKETRKGNNQFHCNIKSSIIVKQSLQDHTNRRQKPKVLAVKKEFDNSMNFVKDLCLIGSNNLKRSRSRGSPEIKTTTDLESNSLSPIEKRLSDSGSEPENVLAGDGNNDLNITPYPADRQSLGILSNHENTDRLSVADTYGISETTKEMELCEESRENNSDHTFIVRHFGNKGELNDCQHRSISNKFDKFGELNITKSLKGIEDIEFKYKTRCQQIELSKSESKDASTIKSLPKHTEHENSEFSEWQRLGNQNMPLDDSFEVKANQPWSLKPNQNWSQDDQDQWIPKFNQTSHRQSRMPYQDSNDLYHQETMSFPYSHSHSNVTANTHQSENRVSQSNPEDNHYLNQEYYETHSPEHSNHLENNEQFSTYSNFTPEKDDHQSPKHNQIMGSGNSQLWKSHQSTVDKPISNMPLVTRYKGNGSSSWYSTEHSNEGECNCCKCTVKQNLSLLTEFMEKMGYEVKNVSSDGNCLFAAIVDQLRINGDFSFTTGSLRKKAVQFLRQRPHVDEHTHLEAFLTDETWDEYLAKMAMDGQWGDDIILKGISELTGRRIIVYSSFMSKTELTPTNLYEKDELYIGHIKSLMHFVSLRPYYWESLWTLRATSIRARNIIDDMRLDSTLLRSCEEEALKKIDELREAIAKGEVDCNGKFQEIEQIFRDLRRSMHKQTTELLEDTQDTMNDLLHQRFEVDKLSGIPMIHLSYLMKLLIQPRHFRNTLEDLESVFESKKDTITRIGTGSLDLNVNLINFTAALQHFEMLAKKVQRNTKPMPLTFVLKLPKGDYLIVDRTEDHGSRLSERSLIVDDTDTYPGYTHLIPANTSYWSGCVEWLSCKEAFLRGLPNKCRPKTLFQEYTQISVQLLDGLDCNFWPRQAQSWTQRNPISGWPSEKIFREASEKGCTVVKRAHEFSENPDIEWQFVFKEAENVLVRSFDDSMMFCFRVFKTLVDHHTRTLKVRLKTYSLLTAMLYCSEIIPQKAWSTNPGGCIMYKVVWLLQSIAKHNIPNYFIPENNMIEHIEDHDLRDLEVRLQVLRWFPFASVYFLLESHSFQNLSVIDNVESSIEEYKTSKDKHKLIESVFVPLCFKLATENMRYKIFRFYNKALDFLDVGFEQTAGVTEEHSMTFKDFILSFLTSVRDNEIILPFAQLVDKEKKTNICQDMLKNKAALPISDILGPEYKGEWRHVHVNVTDDKWNSIYELTGQLHTSYELEECAEILRCSISILQKDLRDDGTDYSGITDDDTKKQLTKSRYQQVYFTLRYLVTFYKHLSKCYESMDKLELFQEHIHDYEEIVGRIDSRLHYESVAKLYRQLGNTEKAKELEDKVTSMKGSGEQQKPRPLLVIIT